MWRTCLLLPHSIKTKLFAVFFSPFDNTIEKRFNEFASPQIRQFSEFNQQYKCIFANNTTERNWKTFNNFNIRNTTYIVFQTRYFLVTAIYFPPISNLWVQGCRYLFALYIKGSAKAHAGLYTQLGQDLTVLFHFPFHWILAWSKFHSQIVYSFFIALQDYNICKIAW